MAAMTSVKGLTCTLPVTVADPPSHVASTTNWWVPALGTGPHGGLKQTLTTACSPGPTCTERGMVTIHSRTPGGTAVTTSQAWEPVLRTEKSTFLIIPGSTATSC